MTCPAFTHTLRNTKPRITHNGKRACSCCCCYNARSHLSRPVVVAYRTHHHPTTPACTEVSRKTINYEPPLCTGPRVRSWTQNVSISQGLYPFVPASPARPTTYRPRVIGKARGRDMTILQPFALPPALSLRATALYAPPPSSILHPPDYWALSACPTCLGASSSTSSSSSSSDRSSLVTLRNTMLEPECQKRLLCAAGGRDRDHRLLTGREYARSRNTRTS